MLVEVTTATAVSTTPTLAMYNTPWNGVLASDGETIVAFAIRRYNGPQASRYLVVSVSTDGGATWSMEQVVTAATAWVQLGGGGLYCGVHSSIQTKWIMAGYGGAEAGQCGPLLTCPDDAVGGPGIGSNWTVIQNVVIGAYIEEGYLAEIPDSSAPAGSVLFLFAHSSDPASYAYSSDCGASWTANYFSGSYTYSGGSGTPKSTNIPVGGGPGACFYAYGYLWLLAADVSWGTTNENDRCHSVFYRSTEPVSVAGQGAAAMLGTTGALQFKRWKNAQLNGPIGTTNSSSYPYVSVAGRSLTVSYGRDINRVFYDPDFFDQDAVAAGLVGATNSQGSFKGVIP